MASKLYEKLTLLIWNRLASHGDLKQCALYISKGMFSDLHIRLKGTLVSHEYDLKGTIHGVQVKVDQQANVPYVDKADKYDLPEKKMHWSKTKAYFEMKKLEYESQAKFYSYMTGQPITDGKDEKPKATFHSYSVEQMNEDAHVLTEKDIAEIKHAIHQAIEKNYLYDLPKTIVAPKGHGKTYGNFYDAYYGSTSIPFLSPEQLEKIQEQLNYYTSHNVYSTDYHTSISGNRPSQWKCEACHDVGSFYKDVRVGKIFEVIREVCKCKTTA